MRSCCFYAFPIEMIYNVCITSIFIICVMNINCSVSKKFHNYTLYRGVPMNDEQFSFMKNLTSSFEVDYWRYPGKVNMSVDFLVPPRYRDSLLRSAAKKKLKLITLIPDVQTEFDKQTVKQYIRRQMDSFDWNSYYRLDDIYGWMRDLATTRPDQIKVFSIGKSYDKRDILVAKVLLKRGKRKNAVIVEGGLHAREWISPAFVTYFLNQVLNAQSSTDDALRLMALKYEWYFVPVANPDGYEYTHTNDRLWRKNRRGHGTDLNRNFDIAFGTVGVSHEETEQEFCGTHAFSEPETKALAKFIESKHGKLRFYLSFHSYGQYIILPYAHSKKHLENYDEMKKIAFKVMNKISLRYGTRYSTGTAYDTVGYLTSGVSMCWVKKRFAVPYVATFELRDTGHYGFALPPAQIGPTCRETMDGVVTLVISRRKKMMGKSRGRRFTISHDNLLLTVNAFLLLLYYYDK